jgi:ATP-dependent DNA helicase PIF1
MKLRCDLVIQNLNDQKHDKSINQESKTHKAATIGLYRPKLEDIDNAKDYDEAKKAIILTIETKTLNLKYKLKRIETYTKFIKEGKATLKLIEENIFLLISNTPSLTLINFISFLNVKIQKSNLSNKENKATTSTALSNTQSQTKKYVNKLLSNVQCTLGKNSLKVISPLCEQEVNDVLKRKFVNQLNQSPVSMSSSQYKTQLTQKSALNMQQVQTPSRSANRNKPIFKHSLSTQNLLVQLTDEQKQVLNEVKNGSNIFFTGSGGTGKSFLINVIRKCLPNDSCFVTASTGVAASLIGGLFLVNSFCLM